MNAILRAKASFIYMLTASWSVPTPTSTKYKKFWILEEKKPKQSNNYKKKKMQNKQVPSEHLTHPGITATSGIVTDKRPRSQDPQLWQLTGSSKY